MSRAWVSRVIVLAICPFAMASESLELGAMKDWSIVVAGDAIPSEQYAAQEFQGLYERATGTRLAIVSEPREPARNIFIGSGKAMAASPVEFKVDDLGEEGLRIRISKDNVAIAGGRPRGTLYGVYEFFERYAGVKFLTFDHTYVPPDAARAKLPYETHSCIPPFSFRWSYYGETSENPAFAARLRTNTVTNDAKFGGITGQSLIGHSLYAQCPVSKYGKTHPEYFALVDGQRKLEMGGGGPELCVTHPDVAEIVAEAVITDLDKNPNRPNIAVSQNDNDAYCRCPRCEEVNQREGTPMGSHMAFVNAVAERVEKKYPKVKIGTLAYWYTRKCPKTVKPRANVQIQLCSIECCTLHAIDDPNCKKNQEFCRDMRDWKAVCNDIWVWNYNTNFDYYDLPHPNLRSIGRNVQFFLNNNAKGVFMQASGNGHSGEMCDLRNYVMSRCLWKPGQDSWALTEEFCRLHYGKAAAPIILYLQMIHDNAEASGCHPGCFPKPAEAGLTPEISKKAMYYFKEAMGLADDDTVRSRVEKASIAAYRATLEVAVPLQYSEGLCRMSFPPGCDDLAERYIDLCTRHRMTMAAESMTAAAYFEQIRRAAKGYPALRIENDVWRLTVLPEQNGKIVEMIHKPTGRDLLRAMQTWRAGPGSIDETGVNESIRGKVVTFAAERDGQSVKLTGKLLDGVTVQRRISLSASEPGKVFFESQVTNTAQAPVRLQIKARPEFNAATRTRDSRILAAYVNRDGSWVTFNEGWHQYDGPKKDLLKTAKGGGLAFFNNEAKFGMHLIYRPDQYAEPRLRWIPDLTQINLEVWTPDAELKTGESLKYAYQMEYLSEPPK